MFYGQYTGFGAGAGSSGGAYGISQSIRFDESDSPRMYRTPSSAGNLKTWTYSVWFKRSILSSVQTLFNSGASEDLAINAANQLIMNMGTCDYISTQVFRDPTSWYHLVVAVDTTNATASSRVRFYLDGTEITDFDTETDPAEDENLTVNSAVRHTIGANESDTEEWDGYIADAHFVDGTVLAATSFGEVNDDSVWVPINYTGSYGTNGFQIQGATASALGTDTSGNDNTYTTSGLTTADSMLDSVGGNFCTFSSLLRGGAAGIIPVLSNGNLDYTSAGATQSTAISSMVMPPEGKWYFEFNLTLAGSDHRKFGVITDNSSIIFDSIEHGIGFAATDFGLNMADGNKLTNDTSASYGSTISTGIVRMAVDIDNGKIWWGNSAGWFASGDPAAGSNAAFTTLSAVSYYAAANLNTSAAGSLNCGQSAFAYTPPTDFLSLNTANSPAATTIPVLASWKDIDANCTFATGTLDANGEGVGRTVDTFPGNFEISFTVTAEVNMGFGVYAVSEDGTYDNANNNGSMTSMDDSFLYNGDDDTIQHGADGNVATSVTWSATNTAKITRAGDVIVIYKNGAILWRFTQFYGGTMRFVLGSGGGTTNIDDITWTK